MKKSNWTLILFILLGLIASAIVTQLIGSSSALAFLTKSAEINWQPKADLQAIKYDIHLQVKLNVISLIGIAGAIWLYRRL